ncbi:uncharacterized protein DS421_9g259070 [Arachis hypogaea]|nr:uncharacterized protein DS421_9g259070 [Arachis hypogaea]
MTTESDRMEFGRYFILVMMKMFLCPTTQQVLSPWHIYPVLDVFDPRRFNWLLEILKWFDTAVEKYKLKGYSIFSVYNTVCLTIVLSMSHGSMHGPRRDLKKRCRAPFDETWGGDDINGWSPQAARRKLGKKEPQKRRQKQSVLPRRRSVGGESNQVSNERRPRGRTSSPPPTAGSSRRAKRSETSTRPNRGAVQKRGEAKKDRPRRELTKKKTSDEPTEGNLNQDKGTHETPISVLPDAGTLSIVLVKHEEWEFDGQVS